MPSYTVKDDIFDKPDYSDITIRLSDRELRCHKVILCSNSDYFAKLCGSRAQFEEKDKSVIELKEDDPHAVEQMLRYLYVGVYKARLGFGANPWRQHLAARTVAEKYVVMPMKLEVEKELRATVLSLSLANCFTGPTIKEIANVIEAMRAIDDPFSKSIVSDLLDKHLHQLKGEVAFRHMLEQDSALMLICLDKLDKPSAGLVELTLQRCHSCQSQTIQPKGTTVFTCQHLNGCASPSWSTGPIWLHPKDHAGLSCLPKPEPTTNSPSIGNFFARASTPNATGTASTTESRWANFGQPSPSNNTAPATGGLFGNFAGASTSNANAPFTGGFGRSITTTPATGSLFGNSTGSSASNITSGSLFGNSR